MKNCTGLKNEPEQGGSKKYMKRRKKCTVYIHISVQIFIVQTFCGYFACYGPVTTSGCRFAKTKICLNLRDAFIAKCQYGCNIGEHDISGALKPDGDRGRGTHPCCVRGLYHSCVCVFFLLKV